MATVYITEFPPMIVNTIQIAVLPPIIEQTVAIGGAAVLSNFFHPATGVIRVHADAVCSISVGFAPLATSANMRLAANSTEYFSVRPGERMSVITNV